MSLPYKNHGEMPFGIIADLASEKLNPSIDKAYCSKLLGSVSKNILLGEVSEIYASPSKRCRETASLISDVIKKNYHKNILINTVLELKEIGFDLRKIYPLSENSHFDIEKINNKVFRAMENGTDCELALETYKRVNSVFSLLKKRGDHEKTLLITHDFYMRVVELYIRNKGRKKDQITHEELGSTQRNGYISGFGTSEKLSGISFFAPEKIE